MQTPYGHLTYCTNIHPGESWADHFAQLRDYLPAIKKEIAPDQPFGVGLRLSDAASRDLLKGGELERFKAWLQAEGLYVFTMNGFPFGGFHRTVVKDAVHQPDWTTPERREYTIRLARLLAALLPEGMEGSISTSPLSYRPWHEEKTVRSVTTQATANLLRVVEALSDLRKTTGRLIHIDLEPEPDGLISNGLQFIQWYQQDLLPAGLSLFQQRFGLHQEEATALVREHVQLCYDICHFAVGFEPHKKMLKQLKSCGIKVGKLQISAALKGDLTGDRKQRRAVLETFAQFDEPTYLHQVVARQQDGSLLHYADLPQAFEDKEDEHLLEWRAHFHVPVFVADYGLLQSTRSDIETVLALQAAQPFTRHMEVETYTWTVLPEGLKQPMTPSIFRELNWVLDALHGDA